MTRGIVRSEDGYFLYCPWSRVSKGRRYIDQGCIEQGTESPSVFVREHIRRGHIVIASMQAQIEHAQAQTESEKSLTRLVTLREQELADERARQDQNVFTPKELSRLAFDLIEHCPTFEQGRDRWVDFAPRMRIIFRRQNCPDDLAKEVLWIAIKGTPSRMLVASMNPSQGAYESMTLDEYMAEMAGKFTPASESVYLKTEYKSRKQGKMEDVECYISEKFNLYQLAYPNANNGDLSDFYVETTKGIANRYVRSNLGACQPTSVNDYTQKAVFWAHTESI